MSPASISIITALLPGTPTGLQLIARSFQSLTFQWQPPADNGGSTLISYKVYQAVGSGTFQTIIGAPASTNPSITIETVTGLTSAQYYSFKVSAVNVLGESTISPAIFVINANLPSKPVNPPAITLVTPNSISLNLTPITDANNGGSPVTSYIVEMDDGLGGVFQTVSDSLTTSLILSGL